MRRLPAILLLAFSAAAAADLDPGSWELSVTSQMPGMPQPIGPITHTQCVTAEDARDPSRIVGPSSGSCEFSNQRDSGSQMTFDIACSGQIPMRGSGSVRYGAQSFEADLNLTAEAQGQKIATSSHVTGRRVGECR
jgi:hypothetical protein